MNNMGVLKTKNGSAIFNSRLSWFIYTLTENLRISKKISTFWHFILILINIAPNIVKPYKNQHFHPPRNPNPNPQSKPLSSYINTKIQRKIHTFTDYQLCIKNLTKKHQIHTYIQFKKRIYKHSNQQSLTNKKKQK